jgi:hypothetical protein
MKTNALALIVLTLVVPASAAPEITFVTSRQALGAFDHVDWNVLGSEGAHLGTPQTVITNGGVGVTLSTSTGDLRRYDQSSAWAGNFAPGDRLVTVDSSFPGPDSISLQFSPGVAGVGTQIQPYTYGSFMAQMDVFDLAGNLIGSVMRPGTSNGNSDNSAIFLGARVAGANIGRITYTMLPGPNDGSGCTGGICGGIALNVLDVTEQLGIYHR